MVGRLVMSLAALPLAVAGRLVHRLATGSAAVLDVRVEPIADLRERQGWLRALRRAGEDPLVSGVLLRLDGPPGGWAACSDFRNVILDVRKAGTPVYALLEAPGNALMWLASACDRVFIVPTGEVGLVGVGVELTFFGDALERLGVKPDFAAAGAYKSFGETWTRSFPSAENQEAVDALVQGLHEQLIEGIAQGRSMDPDVVRDELQRAPLSPPEACDVGLVDQLAYPDQVEEWLKEQHGAHARLVGFAGWAWRTGAIERARGMGGPRTAVSVLHLQGPVVMADQPNGPSISARKVTPILKALREDDNVGAVVLHIDSPGGSALASDLIWREVDELARSKPVVASFEDTAASGGYYVAAPAAEILVRPGTLTGSIGVFGGKLVMGEGLRKVGVHSREVLGAPNANLFSAARRFTDAQRDRFRASLQRFYDGFVQRVAAGRDTTEEAIEPHCRGRVWLGSAALERSLADAEGDLDRAVDRARRLAGLGERGFVRRDLASYQVPLGARLMQAAMRRYAPGALLSLARLAERTVGGGWLVQTVLAHPEQPLAMLPFDVRPR